MYEIYQYINKPFHIDLYTNMSLCKLDRDIFYKYECMNLPIHFQNLYAIIYYIRMITYIILFISDS